MNEEEIRRLRINLLRQLKANSPLSLPIPALLAGARIEAFAITDREVLIECEHLADPSIGFVSLVEERFSKATKRFKITAPGREWLASEGF